MNCITKEGDKTKPEEQYLPIIKVKKNIIYVNFVLKICRKASVKTLLAFYSIFETLIGGTQRHTLGNENIYSSGLESNLLPSHLQSDTELYQE